MVRKFGVTVLIDWLAFPEAVGLQVPVLMHGIEAGTLLQVLIGSDPAIAVEVGTQVAMTEDDGFRESLMEVGDERSERLSLGFGTRVACLAVSVQASFVAHTDGVSVVILDVGTFGVLRPPLVDGAVKLNIVVVADVMPAVMVDMVMTALPEGVAVVAATARAVEDY